MGEPLHDIDKLFFDEIEGRNEYPPTKVWDKIEAGLDKTSAGIYKKKYEKIKRATIILLILIAGILVYEIGGYHHSTHDLAGNNESGNTKKQQEKENINKPGNQDNGNTTEQDKNSLDKEPPTAPVKQEENSKQKNSKEINNIPKQDQRNLTSQTSLEVRGQEKKKISQSLNKDKTSQPVQGLNPQGNPNSSLTNNKKTPKSTGNKDVVNKPQFDPESISITSGSNGVHKNKLVAKQNIPSSVDIPEEKQIHIDRANENGRPLIARSKLTRALSLADSLVQVNRKIELPGFVSISNPAKEEVKSSKNMVKIHQGKSNLSLLLSFSPNIVWTSLANDMPHQAGGGGNHIDDHDAIKKNEQNKLSYTGGVKLNYGLTPKLSVQTGLNLTLSSSSVGPKLIFADRDNNGNVRYRLDCSSGYSYLLPKNSQSPSPGDSLMVNDTRNSLTYLGVPLTVAYKILSGKFSLSAAAGGQANILLKGKTTTVFGKGTATETTASGKTQALKAIYFSTLAGITGEYRLNKKMALTITPSSQFGLSSINKGGSAKTRTNSFSIEAGLKIKL